ncbi:vomeronasal type-2 receptor 26-like [Bufo bufo]|uniref:vomeronasal type-2 receptor 26-like n=1 Tax=Bufo bufo TaxID=8384 RepID=UPI001ABE088D|nr:vomeronasal type-2 receptor 26-like [Bufo bufo]
MGTRFAPSYANLFMANWEDEYIQPILGADLVLWKRYIDDVIFIWRGTDLALGSFLSNINLNDQNLQFTANLSKTGIEFLDLKIDVDRDKLSCSTYYKPTARNNFILHSSCHLPRWLLNVPTSQFRRLKRNCTKNETFENEAEILRQQFVEKDYPNDCIEKALNKLNQYIRRVRFTTSTGDSIHLDEKGNFPARFDLVNYDVYANSTVERQTVGHFHEDNGHYQFPINDSFIFWDKRFPQIPRSACSESCLPGYRKVPLEGKQKCCYYCVSCAEGEVSHQTDMEGCLRCPEDQWSNERRDTCIPRLLDFLSYEDTLGLSLIIINLFFCSVTVVVLGIFIKHKNTLIVKANNQNLSYILLLSLLFSFLCPLLFIGRPTRMSCLLRQVAFGNIFSLAVSSILAKTVTVVLAFRAIQPGRTLRQWLGRRLATSLLITGTIGEVVICVFWLSFSPPFPDYNTEIEVGKIILQCNEGSAIAFYLVIGYIGFLAMLSFIVAFLARKLPDTFNEAQYITFSMLVFCSVWISFIPAYLSTKGKDMVAVEIFAITSSSAGLLGCIFIPKCYIILMRPGNHARKKIFLPYQSYYPPVETPSHGEYTLI